MRRQILVIFLFIAFASKGASVDSLIVRLPKVTYKEKVKLLAQIIDFYSKQKSDSVLFYYDELIATTLNAKDTTRVIHYSLLQIEYMQGQGLYFDLVPKLQQVEIYISDRISPQVLLNLERNKGRVYWRTRDFEKAFTAFSNLRTLSVKINDSETEAIAINNLGLIYSETGKFDSAVHMHNLALKMYMNIKSLDQVSHTYNLLGNACLRLNRFDEAIVQYKASIKYSEEGKDSSGIARTLKNLARTYTRKGSIDSAVVCLQSALNIEQELKQEGRLASIYNELGATYWSVNNYSKALQNYQSALQIRRDLGDIEQIAATLNNIGTIYKDINMSDIALEYYDEALTMHQALSSEALIALSLNYIGGVYYKRGQFDYALDYYLSALGYYEINDDKIESARIQNNVALMYKNIGNYEKAFDYYQKALDIYLKLTDYKSTADVLNNIGNLYMVQTKYKEALEYFELAQEKRREIRDYKGLVASKFDMATLKIKTHKYEEAIELLKQTWRENRVDIGYEMRRNISLQLAESYEQIKDFKQSIHYRKLFEAFNDSLINQDLLLRIMEVKSQNEAEKIYYTQALELEKKEAEVQVMIKEQAMREKILTTEAQFQKRARNMFVFIATMLFLIGLLILSRYRIKNRANAKLAKTNERLNELNEKLKKSEEQVRASNRTKDKLFGILAHDLRSPFTAFLELTQLLPTMDDKQLHDDVVKEITQSANSIFVLLENLLEWSRAQSYNIAYKANQVSPYETVQEVYNLYYPQIRAKMITFTNNIPEQNQVKCDPSMLSFVFRNLVNNAIKFVRQGGKITIYYKQDLDYHTFIVSDNGQGILPENLYKLFDEKENFTTHGSNNEKGSGMGLKLCKEFVVQWGGEIKAKSDVGQGTDIEFTLPT
ncbi:MAG: tetratricopeptide repeat-containing sensor histidine kinase [Salinivirgaceae bacterium]|nr:tetratricopeptide repeat-containing sensor histidine kinase [Salinivirgaceae bacterium]MDD4746577.1 tetratricopeptide repeat-containing sensor histidine kinase [Salinivirgaceae bacterium]MDY0280380.1 tetratricopeptide repeat-containing sensor histidine kinase [Salinivirgaceae bacterium]